jgi:geranylgeranyl diphosphate synthase type 3
MIEAFNKWLNVPESKLKAIARVVNMLHSASLLQVFLDSCLQLV